MKKSSLIIPLLLLSIIALSIFASAQTTVPGAEQIQQAQQQISNLPKTPAELQQITSDYLVQEWSKIVAKIPVIGPLHSFLLAHPLPFIILFNEPYSFSLTFILIFILWLYIAIFSSRTISSAGFVKPLIAWLLGLLFTILTAQINLISYISTAVLAFIFSYDAWWARTLLFLVVIVVFVLLSALSNILSKYLKEIELKKEKQEIKQGIKESKALKKGLKEGQKLTER